MAPRKPAAAPTTTRRSARLAPPAPEVAAGPDTTNNRITKTKASAKPKPQKYDCSTCGRTLAASSFPNHLATDDCKHLINTCKACTKAWISSNLEGVTYDKLSCPECPELLKNADVQRLATREVWKKYDEMERHGIAEKVPGWRWCMNPKCREGQVHEPLLKKLEAERGNLKQLEEEEAVEILDDELSIVQLKKKKPELVDLTVSDDDESSMAQRTRSAKKKATTVDLTISGDEADGLPSGLSKRTHVAERAATAPKRSLFQSDKKGGKKAKKSATPNPDDICTCHACGAKACIPCDHPYHEGETCAQYQRRRKRQTETEEKATRNLIESQCKKCPKCSKNIEKNGGCDQVVCTQCYDSFCWRCVTSYTTINRTGHAQGCAYAVQGAFDPHAAPNAPNGWNVFAGGFAGGAVAGVGVAGAAPAVPVPQGPPGFLGRVVNNGLNLFGRGGQ